MAFEKYIFISVEQQKAMLLIYNEGQIDFQMIRKEGIYRNERSFLSAMNCLIRNNAVFLVNGNAFYDKFGLTRQGIYLIEHGVIPLEERENGSN